MFSLLDYIYAVMRYNGFRFQNPALYSVSNIAYPLSMRLFNQYSPSCFAQISIPKRCLYCKGSYSSNLNIPYKHVQSKDFMYWSFLAFISVKGFIFYNVFIKHWLQLQPEVQEESDSRWATGGHPNAQTKDWQICSELKGNSWWNHH